MKKYGDDADSVHDQGTRIEASERGYEQNQLRNDYAYRSVSKSNYRSYNKKDNKSRNINKTPYTHYTQFNDSNFKPNWSCAPNYDKNYYERNKTGGNKSFNSASNSNDDWIVGLCCLGIVIIFIIFAIL